MGNPSTYIKLDRNILKWRWYQDGNTFRVFVHLLLTANVADRGFRDITIRRGQRVVTRKGLAADLDMSEQAVRTALEHLEETGEITKWTCPKYSVVTIVNYDLYQKYGNAYQPTNNQAKTVANKGESVDRGRGNQPTTNQQTTNRNPGKSEKSPNQQPTHQPSDQPTNNQVKTVENKGQSCNLDTPYQPTLQPTLQPTNNQQLTNKQPQYKNDKEIKEKKNNISSSNNTSTAAAGSPRSLGTGSTTALPKDGEIVYYRNDFGEDVPHKWTTRDSLRFKKLGFTDIQEYILTQT